VSLGDVASDGTALLENLSAVLTGEPLNRLTPFEKVNHIRRHFGSEPVKLPLDEGEIEAD
jgi:hypothetical protein